MQEDLEESLFDSEGGLWAGAKTIDLGLRTLAAELGVHQHQHQQYLSSSA